MGELLAKILSPKRLKTLCYSPGYIVVGVRGTLQMCSWRSSAALEQGDDPGLSGWAWWDPVSP